MKAIGAAPGGQRPDPHRGSLSPVAGLHDHLGGAGAQGGVGGGVARAVVDHHDLDAAVLGHVRQAVAQPAHRVTDAVGLAVGGHDHAEAHRARGGRSGPPGLACLGELAQQHPAVADQPHGTGGDERDDLRLDERDRGREAGAGVQATQHDDVDDGGDERHADEGGRHLDPAHVRVAAEGHGAVQGVRHDARPDDRRQVGDHQDPSELLAEEHEQRHVDQRRHQGQDREAAQPCGQAGASRSFAKTNRGRRHSSTRPTNPSSVSP